MASIFNRKQKDDPQFFSFPSYSYTVTEMTTPAAMKNPVVASIVNLISNSIASMNIKIYQETKECTQAANWTAEAKILQQKPNGYQTGFTFFKTVTTYMVTEGQAFIFKQKDGNGLTQLIPIAPGLVTVRFDKGVKLYTIANEKKTYTDNEIIHLLFNSLDGLNGYPQFTQHSEVINHDNTLRKFSKKYFSNSSNLNLYISAEGDPSDAELERLKKGFSSDFSSVENVGKTPVLPSKFKINSIQNEAKSYDLVDSLQFSLQNIARCWNVPASKIGSKEGASYNSMEAENIAFLQSCIQPIIECIEDGLDLGLFYNTAFYTKFDTSSILRTTATERYNAYRLALGGNAFLTANEVRRLEEYNPVQGADVLQKMLNTTDINAPVDLNTGGKQ